MDVVTSPIENMTNENELQLYKVVTSERMQRLAGMFLMFPHGKCVNPSSTTQEVASPRTQECARNFCVRMVIAVGRVVGGTAIQFGTQKARPTHPLHELVKFKRKCNHFTTYMQDTSARTQVDNLIVIDASAYATGRLTA